MIKSKKTPAASTAELASAWFSRMRQAVKKLGLGKDVYVDVDFEGTNNFPWALEEFIKFLLDAQKIKPLGPYYLTLEIQRGLNRLPEEEWDLGKDHFSRLVSREEVEKTFSTSIKKYWPENKKLVVDYGDEPWLGITKKISNKQAAEMEKQYQKEQINYLKCQEQAALKKETDKAKKKVETLLRNKLLKFGSEAVEKALKSIN